MTENYGLQALYEEYLLAGLATDTAQKLVDALHLAGLEDEAAALEIYADRGIGATYIIPDGLWQGRECVVSDEVPEPVEPGTLWFDLTELTHMIFLPSSGRYNPDLWIAVHPVYVWQFRTFLSLLTWKKERREPIPADVLLSDRFDAMDERAFVTDMYQEEAAAYAMWLRKEEASWLALDQARRFLPSALFESLLPNDLLVWDGLSPQEPDNEFFRIAVGKVTLDYDYVTRIRQLNPGGVDSPKDIPDSPRVLYEVWERSEAIGCQTSLMPPPFNEWMRSLVAPMPAFNYVISVTNFAPRPSIDRQHQRQ